MGGLCKASLGSGPAQGTKSAKGAKPPTGNKGNWTPKMRERQIELSKKAKKLQAEEWQFKEVSSIVVARGKGRVRTAKLSVGGGINKKGAKGQKKKRKK